MAFTQIDLEKQSKDQSLVTSKIKDGAIIDSKIASDANISISKLNTTNADFDNAGKLKSSVVNNNVLADNSVTSSKIVPESINNTHIDASANISISKLNTTNADFDSNGILKSGVVTGTKIANGVITNTHIASNAAIEYSKLNIQDGDLTIAKTAGLQSALDSKLNLSGGTMSGNIFMNGNLIKSLGTPIEALDAVNKSYVDNLVSGISWKEPVKDIVSVLPNDPQIGDRYLLNEGENVNKIAEWDGTQWIYYTPLSNWAVFVEINDSGYTYNSESENNFKWVQFTGAGQINAGIGLEKDGNTLNVKLGAGIIELPTDEIGIDLYPNGGLELTSNTSGGQLKVKIDDNTIKINNDGQLYADNNVLNPNGVLPPAVADQTLRYDSTNGWSATSNLIITNTGNIGIGTTNPLQKLSIVGDIGLSGGDRFIGTIDNYALSLRTNNTDRIYITNAGNVGIGTVNPTSKLDVNGDLKINNIKVEGGILRREKFTMDGVSNSVSLANLPLSGREILVYLNGVLLWEGTSDDYVISNSTVSFNFLPSAGDKVQVIYYTAE